VPAEERSAELFDDEKALDRYRKTRLFTSGALTLDLLACYDSPLPFVSQHVPGSGPVTLLVAENLATYTSFLTAVRALDEATRPHLHVAWGTGGSFEQSVLSIPLLDPQPRHVRYFGDLDRAGLRIAASAARQAAQADLPPMLPATGCYQFLLDAPVTGGSQTAATASASRVTRMPAPGCPRRFAPEPENSWHPARR
jgi:hypothetical protein